MKTSKILLITILIMSTMATACTSASENPGNDKTYTLKEDIKTPGEAIENLEDETVKEAKETVRKIRPKIADSFLEKLSPGFTAADIGIYIRENIVNASKDEADKMIESLIIYQEKVQRDFNTNIWKEEYMDVLNNHIEGSLDKSKVNSIENEKVKNDYITLVKSFLTIVYYDGYPVVEMDWVALMEYSEYLSDDFRTIIELNKKFNYYEYNREELDVDGLSKDIIILEEIAKNNKSTFINWQANYLCRSLIYDLLLGPENVYLFYYDGKGSKEYYSIMALRDKYPESKLKEIIEELDFIDEDDIWAAIHIIVEKLQFGINSNNYIKVNNMEVKNGEYELVEITMPSNIEKQNKINNIIKLDTEEYIERLAKDKSFSLFSDMGMVSFQNDRYISYGGELETIDSDGNENSYYFHRTFDYIKEKYITLEDFFEADFIFIQEYIEKVGGIKIESLPEFQLEAWGIDFYINQGTDNFEFLSVDRIDLLDYFTLDEVLNKVY